MLGTVGFQYGHCWCCSNLLMCYCCYCWFLPTQLGPINQGKTTKQKKRKKTPARMQTPVGGCCCENPTKFRDTHYYMSGGLTNSHHCLLQFWEWFEWFNKLLCQLERQRYKLTNFTNSFGQCEQETFSNQIWCHLDLGLDGYTISSAASGPYVLRSNVQAHDSTFGPQEAQESVTEGDDFLELK